MSNMDNQADCLDRARMHDLLADATEDPAARMMHRAMAAEFRRRASEQGGTGMPPPRATGPIAEMRTAVH